MVKLFLELLEFISDLHKCFSLKRTHLAHLLNVYGQLAAGIILHGHGAFILIIIDPLACSMYLWMLSSIVRKLVNWQRVKYTTCGY